MAEGYGRISDEALIKLRERMGVELPRRTPHVEYATQDTIRHFAHGIGDNNPLWTDPDYASKTRYGAIIAPPCILYSMDLTCSGNVGGLPGVHAMFSGTRFEWYSPIKLNDHITTTAYLSDLIEKSSAFAGRSILQGYETIFKNQSGDVVAKSRAFCIRTERDTAKGVGKYKGITRHRYTEEEIRAIEADYDREEIRGANPRYWEDVEIGQQITPIVKGPLTVTDIVCWNMGWGGLFLRAHGLGLEYRRRHPAASVKDAYGVPDVPERVHWDEAFAKEVGVPGAYDYGPQRISWLGNLMTHWIGDDGFLKTLDVQVRLFNIIGDTTWCRGKVIGKQVKDGEPRQGVVECDVWCENQRGERTAMGTATALLPTRQ